MGYLVGAVSVGLVIPVCKLEPAQWAFLADPTSLGALAYAPALQTHWLRWAAFFLHRILSPPHLPGMAGTPSS